MKGPFPSRCTERINADENEPGMVISSCEKAQKVNLELASSSASSNSF